MNAGQGTSRPVSPAAAALVIAAVATIVMVPAFLSGHIIGYSSFLNVGWSEGFSKRLFDGDLYPRWLPEMSLGAGSPAFYFYAPLPFYLTAPFHLVAERGMAVVLGSWLMLGLSGLSFLVLARSVVATGPALLASLVYMVMPYHLLADVWVRAALGEQAAFIFMPLCLLCALRLDRGNTYALGLAASFAMVVCSHLPTALLLAPFITGLCLSMAWKHGVVVLLRSACAALLAGGLSAAYLLPALSLQGMIAAQHWYFYPPAQALLLGTTDDTFRNFLSLCFAATGLFPIAATIVLARAGHGKAAQPWAVMAIIVALLVTPASAWLWNLATVFDRVQFPWRWLSLFEVCSCMLLALLLDRPTPWRRIPVQILVISLLFCLMLFLTWRGVIGKDPSLTKSAEVDALRLSQRADAKEYMPSCRLDRASDTLVDGSSIAVVERALLERAASTLPVFYFPFLTVTANGTAIPISCDPATGFIVADITDGATVGVAKIALPVEKLGTAISVASLAFLLVGWWLSRRRRQSAAASRQAIPACGS